MYFFFSLKLVHLLHINCTNNVNQIWHLKKFKCPGSIIKWPFFVCGFLIPVCGKNEWNWIAFFIPTFIFSWSKNDCGGVYKINIPDTIGQPRTEIALHILYHRRLGARHEPNCLLDSSLHTNSPTSLSPAQPPPVPLLLSLSAFFSLPRLGEKLHIRANFNKVHFCSGCRSQSWMFPWKIQCTVSVVERRQHFNERLELPFWEWVF